MSMKRRHKHHVKPPVFDPAAGAAARDEGIAQAVTSAVAIPWMTIAHQWFDKITTEFFTSDDVIAGCGLPTGSIAQHRNNAVGGFIIGLRKANLIVPVGYKQSDRKESHRHILRVWAKA